MSEINNNPQGASEPQVPQEPNNAPAKPVQPVQPPVPPMPPVQPPIPPMQPMQPVQPVPQEGKGLSVASMVLGIVSLACFCVWYISIPAAIIGLILGIVAKKGNKPGSGMALAGIIMSIIGLVLTVLFFILGLIGLSILDSYGSSIDWSTL